MVPNNARDAARAVAGSNLRAYPHYLEHVDILLDDVLFSVWVDFEPADRPRGRGLSRPIIYPAVTNGRAHRVISCGTFRDPARIVTPRAPLGDQCRF